MDVNEVKVECLKLAASRMANGGSSNRIVEDARRYADFVLGKADCVIIDAARDLAKKVNQER